MLKHKKTLVQSDRQTQAALLIQKHWKRYVARKEYPKLLKRFKKRTFVALELLQSERTYCESIDYIIKKVLVPSKTLIPDHQMQQYLFSNIEQIYKLHSHFLHHLEEVMKQFNPHKTKLSGVLLKHLFSKECKDAYTKYCFDYRMTDQAIKVATNSHSAFN